MHSQQITDFQSVVLSYYRQYGRELPWRAEEPDGSYDPYKIMVSEIMLQQTQVNRVVEKYTQFLGVFPDVRTLAAANLGAVLTLWSGLGYNRRAKYLHESAKAIDMQGDFPNTMPALQQLPGIGHNTAAAIMAYAHNFPVPFIETNIRTVYIHHFFADKDLVADKELLPVIAATIDQKNPREFYWALMDYGTFLKQTAGNVSRRSAHYNKQSAFQGSVRQIRGNILKMLALQPLASEALLQTIADERAPQVVDDLVKEGLIVEKNNIYTLP